MVDLSCFKICELRYSTERARKNVTGYVTNSKMYEWLNIEKKKICCAKRNHVKKFT